MGSLQFTYCFVYCYFKLYTVLEKRIYARQLRTPTLIVFHHYLLFQSRIQSQSVRSFTTMRVFSKLDVVTVMSNPFRLFQAQ